MVPINLLPYRKIVKVPYLCFAGSNDAEQMARGELELGAQARVLMPNHVCTASGEATHIFSHFRRAFSPFPCCCTWMPKYTGAGKNRRHILWRAVSIDAVSLLSYSFVMLA